MRMLLARSVPLIMSLLLCVAPTYALEIQGEHRLLATYDPDPEIKVAEALVVRWGGSWAELVVTQRWSPSWRAKLEVELSLWKSEGSWDYGFGLLWREEDARLSPWVMTAKPW